MKNRSSNFELLRLVAMMLVLLVHANFLSLGSVTQSELHTYPLSATVRIICEQLCIVSVNLFILISGWFGIRPTLGKLMSLIFQILFIGLISVEVSGLFGAEASSSSINDLLWFGSSYWFVPSYLILFGLAPLLNKYSEHASKREFVTLLVSFFVLSSLFGWLSKDYGQFKHGYSPISFMGLYLLAQYIRRHGVRLQSLKGWQSILFYLLFTAIPATICFVGVYFKNKTFGALFYNSMFVVAASVSLMLAFTKLNFHSKTVNWLASSAFAIYLTHQAPGMFSLYTEFFKNAYDTIPGILFIPFVLVATSIIGLISILLDKVRMVAWSAILKIKDFVVPSR